MSASATCPQCNGKTFRQIDGGPGYMICECVDIGDEINELAKRAKARETGAQERKRRWRWNYRWRHLRRAWERLTRGPQDAPQREMTEAEHKVRHEALHRALDELMADWLDHQPLEGGKTFANVTVLEFAIWSHQQTIRPTSPRR